MHQITNPSLSKEYPSYNTQNIQLITLQIGKSTPQCFQSETPKSLKCPVQKRP